MEASMIAIWFLIGIFVGIKGGFRGLSGRI